MVEAQDLMVAETCLRVRLLEIYHATISTGLLQSQKQANKNMLTLEANGWDQTATRPTLNHATFATRRQMANKTK